MSSPDELSLVISYALLIGQDGAADGGNGGGKKGKGKDKKVKKDKPQWNEAGSGKRAKEKAAKRQKEAEEKKEFVNPTPKGQMKGKLRAHITLSTRESRVRPSGS